VVFLFVGLIVRPVGRSGGWAADGPYSSAMGPPPPPEPSSCSLDAFNNIMRIYPSSTTCKIVKAGAFIDVYSYKTKALNYGKSEDVQGHFLNQKEELTQEEKEIIKKINQENSKEKATHLINANCHQYWKNKDEPYMPVMLTLTYEDRSIQHLEQSNPSIPLFIKRFNYEVLSGDKDAYLKYVTIPEWQKDGTVHYHMALFNMPFVQHKKLTDIWGHGHIWLTRSDRTRSVGRYMTKYMVKGFDDHRMQRHKKYMPSQGLFKPEYIYDEPKALAIKNILPASREIGRWNYTSKWLGNIEQVSYNLGRGWNFNSFLEDSGRVLDVQRDNETLGVFEAF